MLDLRLQVYRLRFSSVGMFYIFLCTSFLLHHGNARLRHFTSLSKSSQPREHPVFWALVSSAGGREATTGNTLRLVGYGVVQSLK